MLEFNFLLEAANVLFLFFCVLNKGVVNQGSKFLRPVASPKPRSRIATPCIILLQQIKISYIAGIYG